MFQKVFPYKICLHLTPPPGLGSAPWVPQTKLSTAFQRLALQLFEVRANLLIFVASRKAQAPFTVSQGMEFEPSFLPLWPSEWQQF